MILLILHLVQLKFQSNFTSRLWCMVHGIWQNSWNNAWIHTNFKRSLENNGFKVYVADYSSHNAETFDPYAIPKIGNHGIDSINKTISKILKEYHLRSIADSQVDLVSHSMGGLMSRGYSQQSYYKNENNYMEGYIHRLITIGTPHYGAPLSKILHNVQVMKCIALILFTQIFFTSFVYVCNPLPLPTSTSWT